MESTHCFMLLHHIHSELLLLVHSLQVDLMAHGVRHCLALWLAEEHFQKDYDKSSAEIFSTEESVGVKPPVGA